LGEVTNPSSTLSNGNVNAAAAWMEGVKPLFDGLYDLAVS